MTTYTIAYTVTDRSGTNLLLAVVPDGEDIDEAARSEIRSSGLEQVTDGEEVAYDTESGLTLTDERPDDHRRIAWSGHSCGWLTDEHGTSYDYAVRP